MAEFRLIKRLYIEFDDNLNVVGNVNIGTATQTSDQTVYLTVRVPKVDSMNDSAYVACELPLNIAESKRKLKVPQAFYEPFFYIESINGVSYYEATFILGDAVLRYPGNVNLNLVIKHRTGNIIIDETTEEEIEEVTTLVSSSFVLTVTKTSNYSENLYPEDDDLYEEAVQHINALMDHIKTSDIRYANKVDSIQVLNSLPNDLTSFKNMILLIRDDWSLRYVDINGKLSERVPLQINIKQASILEAFLDQNGTFDAKLGRLLVDIPTENDQATNKLYVDDEVRKLNKKSEILNEDLQDKMGNLEEHTIEDTFYERMTASDSTGSKYEIKDRSIATPIKIGGMSYKSDNLLSSSYFEQLAIFSVNYNYEENKEIDIGRGMKLKISNGSIIFNGTYTETSTGWVNIIFKSNSIVLNGTYSNEFFVSGTTTATPIIRYQDANGNVYFSTSSNEKTRDFSNLELTRLTIALYEGTYNNYTIKPMIVSGITAPTEFTPYFEGLRSTKVSAVESKGNNLLDTKKLIIKDNDFTISKDSYISISSNAWNSRMFNSHYDTTTQRAQSLNGILLTKGSYYVSFKAKLNSGSGNLNSLFITLPKTQQITTTKNNFPTISSEYQTYNVSFTLETDCEIGLHFQVNGNASSMIFEIKDLMISKGNVEYQPYWEDRFEIPSEIQALDGYGLGVSKEYNNYIDFERKVFVQNVVSVNMKDLGWRKASTTEMDRFYCYVTLPAISRCDIVTDLKVDNTTGKADFTREKSAIIFNSSTQLLVNVGEYGLVTLEDFTTMLNEENPKIVYVLETPIETDISEYLKDYQYKVDNLGTEILVNEYQQKAPTEISYSVSLGQQIIENSDNIAKLNEGKLDKITNEGLYPRLYGVTAEGIQERRNVSDRAVTLTVPFRDQSGNFKVGDLNDDSDVGYVTNKRYVDNISNNLKTNIINILKEDINYQAKRIEQLEKASEGTILETIENEVETSYIRLLGENTLPYTLLETLGGMTYKSENLFVIEDKAETTLNGITYTIKNGVITLNGTATTTTYITLIANCNLPLGTYSYNPKITTLPDGTYLNLANIDGAYISNYAMTFENSVGRLQLQYNEGTVFSNTEIKPMLVSGSTIPTEFSQGFVGLRNSPVTEVVNNGANIFNLEDKNVSNSEYDFNITNGVVKIKGTLTKQTSFRLITATLNFKAGDYAIELFNKLSNSSGDYVKFTFEKSGYLIRCQNASSSTFTLSEDDTLKYIDIWLSAGTYDLTLTPMLVYGSVVPTEFKPYREPTIKEIPSVITNLDGYDLGLPKVENCYNYVDFENKKFVKKLQKVVLDGSSDENIGLSMASNDNGIANFGFTLSNNGLPKHSKDGPTDYFMSNTSISNGLQTVTTEEGIYINYTTIYIRVKSTTASTVEQLRAYLAQNPITVVYEMETPIETDISDLLAGFDNTMKVEGLGTITYENEHKQKVPNGITYQRRI